MNRPWVFPRPTLAVWSAKPSLQVSCPHEWHKGPLASHGMHSLNCWEASWTPHIRYWLLTSHTDRQEEGEIPSFIIVYTIYLLTHSSKERMRASLCFATFRARHSQSCAPPQVLPPFTRQNNSI